MRGAVERAPRPRARARVAVGRVPVAARCAAEDIFEVDMAWGAVFSTVEQPPVGCGEDIMSLVWIALQARVFGDGLNWRISS